MADAIVEGTALTAKKVFLKTELSTRTSRRAAGVSRRIHRRQRIPRQNRELTFPARRASNVINQCQTPSRFYTLSVLSVSPWFINSFDTDIGVSRRCDSRQLKRNNPGTDVPGLC
jgi:hypothetical protein